MLRPFLQLRLRLRSLFRKANVENELDEELQYHLDRQFEEAQTKGLTTEEAHYAALRALGPIAQSKEECRDTRAVNWIEDFFQDVRYGVRMLRKNSSFSIVAILALALGIGATTAMFSVAYGLLRRPLPYPNADRLAAVFMNYASRDYTFGTMCIRDYLIWKANTRAFEKPVLFRPQGMDLGGGKNSPEQVLGAYVTANFFSTLRVNPLLGRTFAAGEDQPSSASFAVLSESVWRRRFAARSSIIGQTILVNGKALTVIGVVPHAMQLPRPETDVWINLLLIPPTRYGPWFYRGFARLKPGATFAQAQAEMNSIALRMVQQNPIYKHVNLPVLSLRDALLGTALKPAIFVLAGAVGLVLLIAVVNVANLLLVRATVRHREIALRLSLGARRGRLIRQLLTESTLLSLIGGLAGLALAWASVQLIRVGNPGNLPLVDSIRLDGSALAFTLAVSLLTGILFGLVPAFISSSIHPNTTIKAAGRGSGAGRLSGRARAALVVLEVALSLMLLVGAGLLLRSFAHLQQVQGGFFTPPQQLLTVSISPGDPKFQDPSAGLAFYDEVIRRTRNMPGIELAAITDSLPPDRQGDADTFQIEGQTLPPGEMNPVVADVTASAGFFDTLRIPLIAGRRFTERDQRTARPVAIVSQGFARQFLTGRKVIGTRIRQGGADAWMEIVGVVGNVKYLGLAADTDAAYYLPFAQNYQPRMSLVVRSTGLAASRAPELRKLIRSINPAVTLSQLATMEQAFDQSLSRPRFHTTLLTMFASIALLLAAVGIYGLIAYSVAQRTQEIGVRMALGARRADVLRMVVAKGLWFAFLAIVIGLAGSLALTHLLKSMLFGVATTDVPTFVLAAAAILLLVLLATFVPALRATRISPLVALRYE